MSRFFKFDKPDTNAADIIREVEIRGYEVIRIGQPLDILVVNKQTGWCGMCELKMESGAKYLTSQIAFMALTAMPVAFAVNASEVLRFVKTGAGLSQSDKNRLALAIAAEPKRKTWTAKMIREMFK